MSISNNDKYDISRTSKWCGRINILSDHQPGVLGLSNQSGHTQLVISP